MRPGERAARAAAYERARPEILDLVPGRARRVLDLGCATGTTGAALKQRQPVEVVGVEREPEYAREAAQRLDRVVTGDLEQLDPSTLGRFDAVIAADVLEHLVDPWTTLRACARTLNPGGTAVVSLPNVGHWSTYAHLLSGRWPRRPEGIFDATHLRWFTLRDATELLTQADLRTHTVVRRGWIAWRGSRADALAPPLLKVPGIRTLVTFQHVLAAIYAPRAWR
jgi:methionine biosynthesis protein MetW